MTKSELLPFGVLLLLSFTGFMDPVGCQAAGATIITHGLNGSVDDWVIAMASRMASYPRLPGTNSTCYELYFTPNGASYSLTWRRLAGDTPASTDSGEIFIKLDWRQLANDSYSTFDVAPAVLQALLLPNFMPELKGHALAELPLHLIGHSRGGSLVCQMSYLLGTNGVWVDHLTTLDPHPLNNDGFVDFTYSEVDAPANTYENVLFHDNNHVSMSQGSSVSVLCCRVRLILRIGSRLRPIGWQPMFGATRTFNLLAFANSTAQRCNRFFQFFSG